MLDQACRLMQRSIAFSAVHFEQQEYDLCIKECEEAVDIGRENRTDYVIIAK